MPRRPARTSSHGYKPDQIRLWLFRFVCAAAIGYFGWAAFRLPHVWLGFAIVALLALAILIIHELLIAQYRKRSVNIDHGARTITLRNFVYPVRFFDILPKREVVIDFDDLVSISTTSNRHVTLGYFFTTKSRFVISSRVMDVGAIEAELTAIARDGWIPYFRSSIGTVFWCSVAAVILGSFLLTAYWMFIY